MRIFDVPKGWRGPTPLRVAVHGSCRIHDPFEALANNGAIVKVWANNFAVSHTLAEAHQMLNFNLGERDIPTYLLPFIFDDPKNAFSPQGCPRHLIKDLDAFVVEVSELRQVRYRQFFFQIQVFVRNFVAKYGRTLLPWYRAFSLGQLITDEIISDALAGLPPSTSREDRATVESILREVRLEEAGIDTTKSLIEQITANSTHQWIFVSHFRVPGLAGTLMEDRRKLQDIVRQAARECGVDFFDPSEIVSRYGRQRMLANGGADIYHYNPEHQSLVALSLLKKMYLNRADHLSQEPLGGTHGEYQPLQTVASALNALLVSLHRQRLEKLGVDASGLHAHYVGLVDRGAIIGKRDIEIVDLVLRYLPDFDCYHVFRAGLGEVAFLLAAFGSEAVGFDPFSARFIAMTDGARHLQERGVINDNFDAKKEIVPTTASTGRTLAVATQLSITVSAEQEEFILRRLEAYDAILLKPHMLIRQRGEDAEQQQLMRRLRDAGFKHIRSFPQQRLMYCSKTELWEGTGT